MSKIGNQTGYELDQDAGIVYNPGHADNGEAPTRDPLLIPGTSQDISQSGKVTLGSYLSAASKGQVGSSTANSFAIDGNSISTDGSAYSVNVAASSRLSGRETRRQMESAGSTIGSFLDLANGYRSTSANRFNATKDSDYGGGDNPFAGTDIKRVGTDERRRGLDGNSIFSSIKSSDTATSTDLGAPQISPTPDSHPLVQRKISEVLLRNRFNPIERAFVENHTRQVPGGYTVQKKMGQYTMGVDAPEVDEKRLKEVGLNLLVRATGHGVPGADLLDPTNSLQQFSNLAPIVPSISQFTGLPLIDVVNLRAGNIPLTDKDASSNPGRSEYINPENPDMDVFSGKSYGVLNSHFEPFDGPLPLGTLTTTVAGILAIVAFTSLIGLLGLGGTGFNSGISSSVDPINLKLGRRGLTTDNNDQDFFFELFGIPKTDNNWGECVFVGLGAFLGFGGTIENGVTGESVLEGAFNLAMAPGYYAVVIRNAIRDTQQVVEAVEQFASNIVNANAFLAIQNFFKIVESITTSATFRFVMAMVNIGNQVLNGTKDMTLEVDSLPNNAVNRHKKSRITLSSEGVPDIGRISNSALAWKHSSAASRYLLPASFDAALSKMNNGRPDANLIKLNSVSYKPGVQLPALPDGNSSNISAVGAQNRIPTEYVKEVEEKLESEYMPFYFHDLRTNEIISFHAFLSDLSDGFTAAYTNTSGYGRAEEVMVYNNTKRSISFTFTVAATSEEDLNVMYWNINKLVSMMYPQYSRGRAMTAGGDKFIQPFSQIPTASPMIRLRIGDIVKGNYSRFGIARLFGLGQSESVFNMDINPPEGSAAAAPAAAPSSASTVPREPDLAAIRRAVNTEIDERNNADGNGYLVSDKIELKLGSYRWINREGTPANSRDLGRLGTSKRYTRFPEAEIITVIDPAATTSTSTAPPSGARPTRSRRPPRVVPRPNKRYIVKVDPEHAGAVSEEWSYHEVAHSDVRGLTIATIDRLTARQIDNARSSSTTSTGAAPAATPAPASGRSEPNYERLQQFIGNNNPLIRSFESTAGKGLAGFMTDLKFDWNDSPWEIKSGLRAPIMMKVTVSFAPIHDIPMGLDTDGMMRSVPYAVGTLSSMVNGMTSLTEQAAERQSAAADNSSADVPIPIPEGANS